MPSFSSGYYYRAVFGYIFKPGVSQRLAHTWFLEIALVHDISVCVSAPEVINYIHMILNQLNKYVSLEM